MPTSVTTIPSLKSGIFYLDQLKITKRGDGELLRNLGLLSCHNLKLTTKKSIDMKYLLLFTTALLLTSGIVAQVDCAGIEGGSALVDECGDCHQAYVYNFITHAVTFVDIA